MKKLALLSLTLLVFACKKETTGYHLSGTLTGFNDNEMIYINKLSDANRPIVVDSTTLKDGKFSIKLPNVTSKDFNFISFNTTQGNILVIAENAPITITADKSDLRKAVLTGGVENEVFSQYLKEIGKQSNVSLQIDNKTKLAAKSGNYAELKTISLRKDSLTKVSKEMRLKMINEHPNSLVSVMAISDLINFKMIKAPEAKAYFEKMSSELKESRLGINLKKGLDEIREETSSIGDKVADFTAPTPTGEQLNLKKTLGKVTLLDFWASWCRPCRMENPNVVRVYNKYHEKGLEIIGISLDRDANSWKKAIENDGLTWKHVSHLQFWQEPIAKNFGVRSIPAAFLLDENGVIIARDLRGQALEDKIKELLN